MLSKPLADISWADIEALVADQRPEGQTLEFKCKVPRKNEPASEALPEYGKRELLDEVVAFANAEGGDLVIGIDESTDHPKRATAIAPVPDAASTAHRLENVIRDLTDPKVARCDVRAVLDASGSAGVIVVRVQRSADAPHRNLANKEIKVRRGEHSMPMQMREVHDLVRLRDRGIADVEAVLSRRRLEFEESMRHGSTAAKVAFRLTSVPLVPLSLDRVFDRQRLRQTKDIYVGRIGQSGPIQCMNMAGRAVNFRPALRAMISDEVSRAGSARTEILEDGVIEFNLVRRLAGERPYPAFIYPGWYVGSLAGMLDKIDLVRREAGRPETEYALESEWLVTGQADLSGYGNNASTILGSIPPATFVPPLYTIGSRESFNRVVALFERDLFNIAGANYTDEIAVEF